MKAFNGAATGRLAQQITSSEVGAVATPTGGRWASDVGTSKSLWTTPSVGPGVVRLLLALPPPPPPGKDEPLLRSLRAIPPESRMDTLRAETLPGRDRAESHVDISRAEAAASAT